MSASTARHETRALLRAHLAAASGYRHLTGQCPVCYRLLRLAMEPATAPPSAYAANGPRNTPGAAEPAEKPPPAAQDDPGAVAPGEDEMPSVT